MIGETKLMLLAKHIDGGTGTFVLRFCRLQESLKNLKIEIVVLGKEKFRKLKNLPPVRYYADSSIHPDYYAFNLKTVSLFLKELVWLYKIIGDAKPDVVLSIDTHCNLLTAIVKKISSCHFCFVPTIHNNLSAVAKKKLSHSLKIILRILGFFLLAKTDKMICISNGVAYDSQKFFFLLKKPFVVPYGVNLRQIAILKEKSLSKTIKEFFASKKINIISVGRFEPQKDFVTLLKAFVIVHQKIKNTRLILIGDGVDKEKLEKLTRSFKLQNTVFFLGWKENVFPYLKYSHLFVLSSFYEGLSWTLLEAMACALPVISTNAPFGPSEILKKGRYGKLVPIKNKDKMAKAILELLKNKDQYLYYSQQSLKRIKFYSEKKMFKRYKKIIGL